MSNNGHEDSSVVRMENIVKRFGTITALDDVDFTVEKQQVMALLGDNGAGKSTLIKVLSGYHPSDGGDTLIEGRKVQIKSPSDARAFGIETVYQEQALVELMSVARNMFMGREPVRFARFLDRRKMNECMSVMSAYRKAIDEQAAGHSIKNRIPGPKAPFEAQKMRLIPRILAPVTKRLPLAGAFPIFSRRQSLHYIIQIYLKFSFLKNQTFNLLSNITFFLISRNNMDRIQTIFLHSFFTSTHNSSITHNTNKNL